MSSCLNADFVNICFNHSCKPITFMSLTYLKIDLLLTFFGKLNVFVVSNISVIDTAVSVTRVPLLNEIMCLG